jgi:hypothetical protein
VNTDYPLSGLLHCARCESPLWGERAKSGNGHQLYYRSKATPGVEPCVSCRRRIRAADIEQPIVDAITGCADHPVVLGAIAEERQAQTEGASTRWERVRRLEGEIHDIKQQMERLAEAVAVGGPFAEHVREKAAKLNGKFELLVSERNRLAEGRGGSTKAQAFADESARFRNVYGAATPAERKALIAAFVERIRVDAELGSVEVDMRMPGLAA